MPAFEDLKNHQQELIRKSLEGSVFCAEIGADPILALTEGATGELAALPDDWDDLGLLTGDGAQHGREVAQAETTSWGYTTPTRTDITSDTSTIQVTMQETKALTIAVGTGVDLAAVTADPTTGEVRVEQGTRPSSKHYRLMSVAVDLGDAGEIYVARFFPRAKVTNFAEQNFGSGDEAIPWGVTFTGEVDSTLGFSSTYLFGGPGWKALLTKMNIPNTTP